MVQIDTELVAVGETKIINPASYKLAGFEALIFHRYTPVAVRESPGLLDHAIICIYFTLFGRCTPKSQGTYSPEPRWFITDRLLSRSPRIRT